VKRPATHEIPNGPKVRVYDNGGKTLDRYTVVIDGKDWDDSASHGAKSMLGLSEGGVSFSQFTEGKEGKHLGKGVAFGSLSAETQRHIARRLK